MNLSRTFFYKLTADTNTNPYLATRTLFPEHLDRRTPGKTQTIELTQLTILKSNAGQSRLAETMRFLSLVLTALAAFATIVLAAPDDAADVEYSYDTLAALPEARPGA